MDELQIPEHEFKQFVEGVKDDKMKEAYNKIRPLLFVEEVWGGILFQSKLNKYRI